MHIGILGGGQLSRMMALAAYPLGLRVSVLDPSNQVCAAQVAPHCSADYLDHPAVADWAQSCDLITWDFENVPVDCVERLQQRRPVYPASAALAQGQDRWQEKSLFRELDITTPQFFAIDSRPDLLAALQQTGYPAVLKTRRMGYDGKGQAVLRYPEDLEPAWQRLGGQALILEQFVPFDYECSIIGVRSRDGDIRYYPIARNLHHSGVLCQSLAPWRLPETLAEQARDWLGRLLQHFNYVGVLSLELFVAQGQLLVNEMAPRVHNSGHWTMNGAVTSQFENHIRAVTGLPLGDTRALGLSLMLNWIGEMPAAPAFLQIPGLHWHDYGKSSRAGRKVGHANLVAADLAELRLRVETIIPLLERGQGERLRQLMDSVQAEHLSG